MNLPIDAGKTGKSRSRSFGQNALSWRGVHQEPGANRTGKTQTTEIRSLFSLFPGVKRKDYRSAELAVAIHDQRRFVIGSFI
jgi:hypothetical protein